MPRAPNVVLLITAVVVLITTVVPLGAPWVVQKIDGPGTTTHTDYTLWHIKQTNTGDAGDSSTTTSWHETLAKDDAVKQSPYCPDAPKPTRGAVYKKIQGAEGTAVVAFILALVFTALAVLVLLGKLHTLVALYIAAGLTGICAITSFALFASVYNACDKSLCKDVNMTSINEAGLDYSCGFNAGYYLEVVTFITVILGVAASVGCRRKALQNEDGYDAVRE